MIRYVSSRRRQRASNAPTKARIHATYATSWGENVLEQRSTATPTSSGDVSGSPPRRREPREHILAYLSVAVDAAVRLRAVPRPRAGRVGASRRLWERRAGGSGRTSRVLARMRRTPMSSARGGSRGGWSSSPAPPAPRAPSPAAPTSARLLDRARTRLTLQRVVNVRTPVPGARDSETRQRCGLHGELHSCMLSIDIVTLTSIAMILRMFCTPPSTS